MDELEKTMEILKKTLSDTSVKSILQGPIVERMIKSSDVMADDIKKAMNDKPVNVVPQEINYVADTLRHILVNYVTSIINDEYMSAIMAYTVLADNWNNCGTKHSEIVDACRSIKILIEYKNGMVPMIEYIKVLLREVKTYTELSPEPFEQSKHYLKTLLGDLENEK